MSSANIKVYVPGKGEVSLKPTDHLATGGEGAVYLKNNLIFKLFLDPVKAQSRGMQEKIQLLAQVRHPFIIAPLDVLYDNQHQMIGYYMTPAEGVPLMKTFTNSWRDLNGFDDRQAVSLVENMRSAVAVAHGMGAIMVDGNETNYLAKGIEPRIIDIDSWQIGKHPATAIMPSIKDYHATTFDAGSDWFSWAIVSFQVMTGIHPYKGTHPQFKKGDLEGRMRANASVFDAGVKLNTAVRPFDCIPKALLAWYEDVFKRGARTLPPSALWSAAAPAMPKQYRVRQNSAGSISHEKVHEFSGAVQHVSGNGIAYHQDGGHLRAFDLYRKQAISKLSSTDIEALFANQAGFVRQGDSFVFVRFVGGLLEGLIIAGDKDPTSQQALTNTLPLAVHKLVVMGNRLFVLNTVSDKGLVELELVTLGSKVALAVKQEWPVNVMSTRFFDGVGLMDCVGMPFLVIPEADTLTIQKAKCLKEYKIVDGFSRHGRCSWLTGISRADGKLYKLELRSTGQEFTLHAATLVEDAELNIAVTAKGIAASIDEDGVLLVQNTHGAGGKLINDVSISREMQLFALPEGIFYRENTRIFKLTVS